MKIALFLISCLTLNLLTSCGSGEPKFNLQQDPSLLRGTYKLIGVRCGGVESTAFPDSLIGNGVEVKVVYDGNKAERITNFFGCVQHIPISPIEYLPGDVLRMTEQEAVCEATVADACGPISSACTTSVMTQEFKHIFTSDSELSVEIPPKEGVSNPCGPGQDTSHMVFNYRRLEE